MHSIIEPLLAVAIVLVAVVVVVAILDVLDPHWRYLEHGEIIRGTDQYDACNDGWRDDPIWKQVTTRIGYPAPNPAYPAHTNFRRKVSRWRTWLRK